MACLKLLQQCVDSDDPQGFIVSDTLYYLDEKGIRHGNFRVSIETMKLLPGIYAHDLDVSHEAETLDKQTHVAFVYFQRVNIVPIIQALHDQLDVKERDQFAFSALLRHREVMGQKRYADLANQVDPRQRNMFKILSTSYEDKDFHISKKRPKDGVSFGMVPNNIINKLLDRSNRNFRAEGALYLKRDLEEASQTDPDRFSLLLPYLGSFVKFLGNLLLDASPKVY